MCLHFRFHYNFRFSRQTKIINHTHLGSLNVQKRCIHALFTDLHPGVQNTNNNTLLNNKQYIIHQK